MQKELGDSANALTQIAANYTHTDTLAAAKLDQTYPSGETVHG